MPVTNGAYDSSLPENFWYPLNEAHTEAPPAKKTKTSHPHPVVCCDQPCPEAETLCFDDFCNHDFCTDQCQDQCQDLCPTPCQQQCPDPCTADCHGHVVHHQDCMEGCNVDCEEGCTLDHCDMDCTTLCTGLDTCIDPSTACIDSCDPWCNPHYTSSCFECGTSLSAPASRPSHISHSSSSSVMKSSGYDYHSQFSSQSLTPALTPATPLTYDSPHICRVVGCMAGAFEDENSLQDHIEKTHLVKVNDRYVCQWQGCVKRVTKKSNEHISKEKAARANGKTYVPASEPFSDEHLHKLKRHYYVHSGKKAFQCPECGSEHATKAQLKVHMARHNPKDFHCSECDKVFTTQNQLKTHVNAVHKKTKHFRCPDCDYACDDSSNMSSHKRKQHLSGVQCPSHIHGCKYRDGRQSDMEKHMRTAGHGSWMANDKEAFEIWWKKEKKAAEDERAREAWERSMGVGEGKRERRKKSIAHGRTASVVTESSGTQRTATSTPAPVTVAKAEMDFDGFAALAEGAQFAQYAFQGFE